MSMFGPLLIIKNSSTIFFSFWSVCYLVDYLLSTLMLTNSFLFLLIEVTETFSLLFLSLLFLVGAFNLVVVVFSKFKTNGISLNLKNQFSNFYQNYFKYRNSFFTFKF